MDKNLKQVRLVAQRFHQLQGLRVSLAGGVFTLVFGTYVLVPPAEGSGGIWIALAGSFALVVLCQRVLDHYYASAFGRVSPMASSDRFWHSSAVGALFVVVGMVMKLPPLAMGVPFLACFHLWVAIRDWPARTHHLAGFGAALVATLILITPAAAAAPDISVAAAFLLLGAAHVPIGFLDHRLLMSVMYSPDRDAVVDCREIEAERSRRN